MGDVESHADLVITNSPGPVSIPPLQIQVQADVIWKTCDICQNPVRTTWGRCPGCRCSLAL
jgi:hypothetical protein